MPRKDWITQFQGLAALAPSLRTRLTARSEVITLPKDTVIFSPHTPPNRLLFLLNGTVRVQKLSEQGREIVLYRVHAGESCVMTTACLLAYEEITAEGIAETDVTAAAIPKAIFDETIAQSSTFREFVFSAYARRITELFHVIEEIAFQRIDIRLAEKLLQLQDDNQQIRTTHQQLAAELGTAREVISRQLNDFQRRGWITLTRGMIAINTPTALQHLCNTSA